MSAQAHASTKAVLLAMAANGLIAVAKFCGSLFTGSSAMAAEAVHSLVDTGNQILLLVGMKEAARPADSRHPLGYGLSIYWYGFVVAISVFMLGGLAAAYEGAQKLSHPHPISNPGVNIVILLVSMALEGYSLHATLKGVRAEAKARGKTLVQAVRGHRDPAIFAVVYEETAALAGLVAALIGVTLAYVLDMPRIDAITSLVIGAILMVTAFGLARHCKRLTALQAADEVVETRLREILSRVRPIQKVNEVRTIQHGVTEVLVLVSADFRDDVRASTIETITSDVEDGMREEFPNIPKMRVYIECQSTERHLEALEDIGEDADALERDDDDEEEKAEA